ncbi:uncharacterized protein LOC119086413 [Peromyscus leucopus]|uniref:uncharacterized protein LOC119086413 n=1 Tax=Peromyscus leucopus TaxID=10041 RepID=UPI001884AB6A|nr:uncharacterized protein LOC119086413 [Peromyscus leucopus]
MARSLTQGDACSEITSRLCVYQRLLCARCARRGRLEHSGRGSALLQPRPRSSARCLGVHGAWGRTVPGGARCLGAHGAWGRTVPGGARCLGMHAAWGCTVRGGARCLWATLRLHPEPDTSARACVQQTLRERTRPEGGGSGFGTRKCDFGDFPERLGRKRSKIWNASRICVSSLRRGHANLLCIVPILVYVLPKRARNRTA